MALTQQDKDLIVEEALNNIERIVFEDTVRGVVLQMAQNGEKPDEMKAILKAMTVTPKEPPK